MEKRYLGRTGLDVSVLALGGHIFPPGAGDYYPGFYGRRIVEDGVFDTRFPVIEAALECGVTLFGADFDYEARALGKALHILNARDRILITAVVDFRIEPGQPVHWDALEQGIDRLLDLLATDHLELPQIRLAGWYQAEGLLDELLGRLDHIREKGKITCPVFYSSDQDIQVLQEGVERGGFDLVARAFGMLNPKAKETLLPLAARRNTGFIGFVPFQKGWLFDCGREAGLSDFDMARAGLAWILLQEGVTSVLTGASGPGEVRQNAQAIEKGASAQWLTAVVKRLAETTAYDRFLAQVKKLAPELAFDWREMG